MNDTGGVVEKISRILPSNARTKAVDVSRSQPVRPGAPTWGRPEGRVTKAIQDKVYLSSIAAERPLEPVTYRNPTETRNVKIAKDVADKFFETKNLQNFDSGKDLSLSEEVVENSEGPSFSSVNPVSSNDDIE